MTGTIHVLGATGRTGAALCRAVLARGQTLVPVVRTPARWHALALPGKPRVADLADANALAAALADATTVINAGYAAFTGPILHAAPPSARLVLIGTARRYGALDNPPAQQAAAAEALLRSCGRDAVMLHPTMIYGAPHDRTVRRLAALVRRLPILPLPSGGRQLVQPIHVGDLVLALLAAADRAWPIATAVAVGGPAPIPYAELIRAIARATGCRTPAIMPVPAAAMRLLGPSFMRLLADRSVNIDMMRHVLGVIGRPIEYGLLEMFSQDSVLGRTTGLEPATSKTTTWRSTN